MNIVVSLKIVPDDQDVRIASDGALDFTKAKPVVSSYDLNAIEAAAQLAAKAEGSKVIGMTVGSKLADDSKTKKNVLARGVDELVMVADDAYEALDALQTAAALAALMNEIGEWDVVVCGDGSADNYAQQVDVQLAAKLGVPSVNGVVSIEEANGSLICKRLLEDVVETVEVPLPAVISVAPEIAQPRICGMKDILAAGKKPVSAHAPVEVAAGKVAIVGCKAPEQAPRKLEVIDAADDGAIEKFAALIKAAL